MPKEPTTQIAFRLSDRLLKAIDRHVQRLNRNEDEAEFNRADAVRDLLEQALEIEDPQTRGRRMPSRLKTTTVPWHKPKCTHCRKPVQQIDQGQAGWREDDEERTYDPVVVHTGAYCPYYTQGHAPDDIVDLPLDTFRRAPMEAVIVALRRRGDSREERMQWAIWTSVVLGLPYNATWSDAIMLAVNDEVAEALPDRVPTLDELRSKVKNRGRS